MTATTLAGPQATHVLDKGALYREIGWKPHRGQARVVASPARNRVVSAGRRFGKSDMGGHELLPEAFLTHSMLPMLEDTGKRREFWIVGPEYSDSEKEFRVLWNEMSRLGIPFDKPGSYNSPLDGNMHISAFKGRFQVHAKSAKYPDTLVGEGLSGVIMAEAAKLKERVWTKFVRPTLADYLGWALLTSTPEGKNWFYRAWQAGQDPGRPSWASWRMPSWVNHYVYRQPTDDAEVRRMLDLIAAQAFPLPVDLVVDPEIIDLARDMTRESFNQEIAADFTEYVGRVFKEFDEEVHVKDLAYNPDYMTFAASDYGFTNPFVWLIIQVDIWDNVYVLDEFYQSGLTIPEAARELQTRNLVPGSLLKFFPDPALPGESKQLSDLLKVPHAKSTGGELRDRIEMIRRWLQVPYEKQHLMPEHPERLPKLFINRRCHNLIREMNDYRYPRSAEEAAAKGHNAPELPLKVDDHTPEALGRFFKGHFGTPGKQTGGTRVRHSSMSR